MAQAEQGKADLRCNSCGHRFRGWVWYSQVSRKDPGPRRWYPGVPIGVCPECHSEALSIVRPQTVDHPPQD